jgi:Amiloride-sensitive sodium channel
MTKLYQASITTSALTLPEHEDEISFNLFFGKMKYTAYEETEITDLATFVANIGAIVGGWTGMSSVTFAQLFIFALASIGAVLRKLYRLAMRQIRHARRP